MKFKTKKIGILLIIGLILPVFLAYSFNSLNNVEINETNPKISAGYIESFIHIDGSIPGNWSATEGEPWCNLVNGVYIIENVTIDANGSPTGSGILINNSKNVKFIIRNCTIFNADNGFFDSGIWLENTNNGTIINNDCSNNNQGIYLINCERNNITENTANNNQYNGIYLDTNCDSNNITGNTVDNNLFGIQLVTGCDYNNITLNTVTNNVDYGIYINNFGTSCDNNIVFNNTVNDNNRYGICVRYGSNDNSIINNSVNNNIGRGIYLHVCHNIIVTGNNIYSNIRGIEAITCDNSVISGNTINNNREIGIYLYSNSDSNEIKNNTINRNDLGIKLDGSDLNNVTGNILIDNNWCIYETYCAGNIIEFNDCTSPTVELPIYIDDYATGVGAHNWTWAETQPWCSGTGTSWDPYIISDLLISGFGTEKYGIDIRNSNVYFIIQECQIYNSDEGGIYFDNVNNSRIINNNCSNNDNGIYIEYSNNITLFENIVNDNSVDGIFIYESNYLNITENTVNNNDEGIYINICNFSYIIDNIVNENIEEGIYLEECFNNTISGNNANDNYHGIFLWYSCVNNKFFGNTATGNYDGIHLEESNFNTIIENTFNNNDRAGIYLTRSEQNTISENSANYNLDGIYLEDENYYNLITENIFNNNDIGIEIYYSDFNVIIDNVVNNNNYNGIEAEVGNYNTLTGNLLKNNILYGMYLETDSNNNSIFKNFFVENGKHAFDDGVDNTWNTTTIGNYWDNWTIPDINNDGIVDDPYTYIGGMGNTDYLPIAEDGAPQITIISPSEGEIFGVIAPNFNVNITDVYVYEMWYTIDGGLNNYTFTGTIGTINQSLWDSTADGTITLTIYARDIIGNIGSAEVNILKRISSPGGLTPEMIIFIITVSVLGGIAIIGVILGRLIKTGKISVEKLKGFSLKKK